MITKLMTLNNTWLKPAALSLAVIVLAASPGYAQRSNPFASLSGSWTGPGTIVLNTGAKERIRCRAQYRASGAGSDLQIELRCASDSYRFELQSSVSHNNGAVSGTWSEVTRNANGTISGTLNGNQMSLRANSPAFSAMLALTTRGNQQSVSIESPGSEISAVSITLRKGGK